MERTDQDAIERERDLVQVHPMAAVTNHRSLVVPLLPPVNWTEGIVRPRGVIDGRDLRLLVQEGLRAEQRQQSMVSSFGSVNVFITMSENDQSTKGNKPVRDQHVVWCVGWGRVSDGV